jgi:predicted RNase H-like HicB family nuclease
VSEEHRELTVTAHVRHEGDWYWAEVEELPGCFASGKTLDELTEALSEAVVLYLQDDGRQAEIDDDRSHRPPAAEVDELKLCLTA